ncbi:MAG: glycoside hydrolase family 3 C-terminal domain-containing protein [Calditrichaeota bacterium]|nr:glycoside hydrolase family 3 C-terminal domain-containing protein [Calditrichota bacterium]
MKHLNFTIRLFAALIVWASLSQAQQTPQLGKSSAKDVIAAMTVEEKVNLVMGTGMNFPGLPSDLQGPAVGETDDRVPGAAGTTFGIPRLGIPAIVLADGPAGLRIQPYRNKDSTATYYCTAFPIATLLASSWDTDLVERVGRAVGNELKEYGVDILLAPALNIHRNPLGGRNFEYYSEDPLVSGRMAAAMVKGVQSQGVGTALKHFVANNHEWNRNTINVIASERALREIYLKGFEIAITEASPWTIMSSYNKVNGAYTSESVDLLTSILRDDWKFTGLVMTDWFGGRDAIAQMTAGNALLMPGTRNQQIALLAAIKDKTLSEAVLDRNIENILNVILKSPVFQNYKHSNKPDLKAHAQLAREAAAEGMVLLKNADGVLPLKSQIKLALFGNSSYDMVTGGTGSGDVNEAYSISLLQGLKGAGFVTNLSLAETYSTYISEEKAKQPPPRPLRLPPPIAERTVSSDQISRLAAEMELALITIGRNSGEFSDRKRENDFDLSAAEKKLIQDISDAFHSVNKKVVIVLNIGGVIETVSWRDQADAILLAWQPGQEAGNAIADVLSGKMNPSGKLATTFPLDLQDVPSSSNFPGTVLEGPDPNNRSPLAGARAAEVVYEDGIWVGYRYFNSKKMKTSYPFGYGLSYTNFDYTDLKLSCTEFNHKLTASITVTNRGKVAGKEVVQLYLSAPARHFSKPAEELRGFAKTKALQPGESQTLSFELTSYDLASFDAASSSWLAEAGTYTVKIGASSQDIRQMQTFEKAKEEKVSSVSKALLPESMIKEMTVKH